MFCKICGSEHVPTAVVCLKCGSSVSSQDLVISEGRSRLVAILLALFVGIFGVHKFYVGRIGQGIFYFLFCWTGIPFILGLIDAAIYASMTEATFRSTYNAGV